MDFKAAGVLFTDGYKFLAGLQNRDGAYVYDGFGGAREEGEDYLTTAYRETFEEMFEPQEDVAECVKKAKEIIQAKHVIPRGTYVLVVCDFKDLTQFLRIAASCSLTSPLYSTIPLTIDDFMNKRSYEYKAEIGKLVFVTEENVIDIGFPLTMTFVGDMDEIYDLNKKEA